MIEKLLCALGIHSLERQDKWTPSIAAKIVTEFEQTHTCRRCGNVTQHVHLLWNGEDMVPAEGS